MVKINHYILKERASSEDIAANPTIVVENADSVDIFHREQLSAFSNPQVAFEMIPFKEPQIDINRRYVANINNL